MKYVDMYVFGSYLRDRNIGIYRTLLRYNGHDKVISGTERSENSIRMTMIAIIEGLRALKEPCNVTVYSQADFFQKTQENGWKRKSNLDLWAVIDDKSAQHVVKYVWYTDIRSVFRGK